MERLKGALAPEVVASSWLAGAVAAALTLMAAAAGQGVGAVLGGCSWVGVSLPVHRQVWSLVNEPSLAFAASRSALGYWLGSTLFPLTLAAVAVPLLPRRRRHGSELMVVQLAWMAAALGLSWLPLLDREDGHVARWLHLHDLPWALVWLLPVASALLAVPPTLHLLSLARAARTNLRRTARLGVVLTHLVLPVIAWVVLASVPLGGPPPLATAALAAPILAALAAAWTGYPAPYVHDLGRLGRRTVAWLAVAAGLAAAALWISGRVVGEDRVAGLLWGRPGSFDNVRPWIEPAAPGDLVGR